MLNEEFLEKGFNLDELCWSSLAKMFSNESLCSGVFDSLFSVCGCRMKPRKVKEDDAPRTIACPHKVKSTVKTLHSSSLSACQKKKTGKSRGCLKKKCDFE